MPKPLGDVPAPTSAQLAWLRRWWKTAHFSAGAVATVLGTTRADGASDAMLPLWMWRTRQPEPLHALIRLFVLGQAVPLSWAQESLGPVEPWLAMGLLIRRQNKLTATLAVSFHEGALLMSDVAAGAPASDHVMGATNATLVLQRCLLPVSAGFALDLGTGAGLLALQLARQTQKVTATDVNPRALAIAQLNARWHGMRNIRFMISNRFAALPRGHFSLIVGNLPFVVSPENRFVYRDGDLPGDGFAASVVQQAGGYLAPDGLAQFLVQWTHPASLVDANDPEALRAAEEAHLAEWVSGNGCHALILRFETEGVSDYALRWSAGPGGAATLTARTARLARWLRHYERHNIGAISTGLVVLLHAGKARPWLTVEPVEVPTQSCGSVIWRRLQQICRQMKP